MLVITRKFGESITIGPDVKITLIRGHTGQKVKLAIDAPTWVKVQRGELSAIQRDQRTPDGRD